MAPSVIAGQRGKQQWLHGVSSALATTADIDALGSPFPPFKVEFSGKCEEERGQKNTMRKLRFLVSVAQFRLYLRKPASMGSSSFC
jgi:hypothetical protein